MTKNTRKIVFTLGSLLVLSGASYFTFSRYQPKILKKIEEVKGITTTHDSNIPFPKNSEKISFTRTNENKITTFQSSKTPLEIKTFYYNVMTEKGWVVEAEQDYEYFSIISFKNTEKLVKVLASRELDVDFTTVSVEVSDR